MYYIPLRKEGPTFVAITAALDHQLWADNEFVSSFEEQLRKHFLVTVGDVEVGGAHFRNCLIHTPTAGINDHAYIQVNDNGIPLDRHAHPAEEYSIDSDQLAREAIERTLVQTSVSEKYYKDFYTDLSSNYLFPYCEFEEGVAKQLLDSNEFLRTSKILLVGPPGSGKTSLVRKLAYELGKRALKKNKRRTPTPIYFELRNFDHDRTELPSLLTHHTESLGRPHTQNRSREGLLLYIFDGLDELNIENRGQFTIWLNLLSTTLPSARIIITSRESNFISNESFAEFNKIRVLPLQENQIFEYCQRHRGSRENTRKFHELVNTNKELLNLLSNPLTLSLTLALYESKGLLPYNTGELINEIVRHLTENWDDNRSIRRYRIFNPRLARRFLGKLAYNLYLARKFTFDEEFVDDLRPFQLQDEPSVSILDDLRESTGLLKLDEHRWSFTHRYFQDFLCASFLIEKSGSLEGELHKFGSSPTWTNVWRQIAELSSDPSFYAKDSVTKESSALLNLDRLLAILLSQANVDSKSLDELIRVVGKNIRNLDQRIRDISYIRQWTVNLKNVTTTETHMFASILIRFYYLSASSVGETLLDALESQEPTKAVELITQIAGLKNCPQYRIKSKTIVLTIE